MNNRVKKISRSNKRPIRILLWSPKGSGLHYGGPGMSAYRLYSKADPGDFEVSLVHGNPKQEHYDLFKEQNYIANHQSGILGRVQFLRAATSWLRENHHRFDVFHGLMSYQTTVSPAFEAQRLGLPAVVRVASHRADLADKGGLKSLLRIAQRRREMVKQLAAVIAISQAIADELRGYGIPDEKIVRIPNGVDTDQFYPIEDMAERTALRQRLGIADIPTVLFSGTLVPRKQPHLLVESLAVLERAGIKCQLVLAGPESDSGYVATMKKKAAQLSVDDRIIWLGFVKDIAPYYRAADVFCLPSKNEGMSNAILEAMASGLPCVATRISGTTELVVDGTHGQLLARSDVESVTSACGNYLTNSMLIKQHGTAARDKIVAQYSSTAILRAYADVFENLVGEVDDEEFTAN